MSALSSFRRLLVRWWVWRNTRAELAALTDRQLDDVGLARDDVDHAAWLAATRVAAAVPKHVPATVPLTIHSTKAA
ncbi:MAG: DUF1127 domain-containing protein [Pseudomonadota bacterium]